MMPSSHPLLGAQNLLHRLPLRQLIDQLVQVAGFSHDRVFDLLDADAADQALDLRAGGVEAGRLGVEGFEIGPVVQRGFELVGAVAGQPEDDPVDLRLRAALLFRLCNVMRINAGETDCVDAVFCHE